MKISDVTIILIPISTFYSHFQARYVPIKTNFFVFSSNKNVKNAVKPILNTYFPGSP